jgi:hypothetical protein
MYAASSRLGAIDLQATAHHILYELPQGTNAALDKPSLDARPTAPDEVEALRVASKASSDEEAVERERLSIARPAR